MQYKREKDFEDDVVNCLREYGWKGFPDKSNSSKQYKVILSNVTEEDLIENWKNILFENNKDILNGIELSNDEMNQVIQKVQNCQNFVDTNTLINSEYIGITRTNKLDSKMLNKEIQLKIFKRRDINAGESIYQIARQVKTDLLEDEKERRSDVILLINGMPLIHIELKNSGENILKAITQIKNYSKIGFYKKGIFKLIQIVVAMKPNEMMYMPSTNNYEHIVAERFLKWTDQDNKLINDWKKIIENVFRIPNAHRMIADFTIADVADHTLKVLRSYQIHAVNKVQNKFFANEFFKNTPSKRSHKGGYVWHATGSGKTLTSFKLATLLLEWNQADIVVFVVDRIELGTQTKDAFKNFNSSGQIEVSEAANTNDLIKQLSTTSESIKYKLIITTINKQANIDKDFYDRQLAEIAKKRVVFIFDEAHRSTHGDMFKYIIESNPNAVVFGFTGTPIFDKNLKAGLTTEANFGPLLHKYTMKSGIEDKKVLGFNCEYKFLDKVLLPAIKKLDKSEGSICSDNANAEIKLNSLKNLINVKDDELLKFEENIYRKIKDDDLYKEQVVNEILKDWKRKNIDNDFSAIFATSGIKDAIRYYEIFSQKISETGSSIKFTALFDSSTDISKDSNNPSKGLIKDEKIRQIIARYNQDFNTKFDENNPNSHANFKVDIQNRLARKYNHKNLSKDLKLDILIVVEQLLTGYDSKYINTVYFDKTMAFENLIQAISRTNRNYNANLKPYGNVVFFKQPGKMKWNMQEALAEYADFDPGMAMPKSLEYFYTKINESFLNIQNIFSKWDFVNFESVPEVSDINETDPETLANLKAFLSNFQKIRRNLTSAQILGFDWDDNKNDIALTKDQYELIWARIKDIDFSKFKIATENEEEMFLILELADVDNSTFNITVNNDYLNALLFEIKKSRISKSNDELHYEKSDSWSELEQKYIRKYPMEYQYLARECINEVLANNDSFNEFDLNSCVCEKISKKYNDDIENFAQQMNIDSDKLRKIINSNDPINVNGRLNDLCDDKLEENVKLIIANELGKANANDIKQGQYRKHIKDFIIKLRNSKYRVI